MDELRRMQPGLGTFVEVGARSKGANAAIEAAFVAIERAQTLWSFQNPHSELSLLNGAPTGSQVPVHADTLRLLKIATLLMRASGQTFDCTIGGMLVDQAILPDHGGPAPLPRGQADDIELGHGWARLHRPLRLTLDGLAKGYAVDLAIRAMKREGAMAGWVNAGGDLRVFGDMALPVRRRELDGRYVSLGMLREAAMASSKADDEQAPLDADFPGRIVAPAGQAPQPGMWTVLARSAWRADALTKVAATTPPSQREALVSRLGGHLITPTMDIAA